MHREQLRQLLKKYEPTAEEVVCKERMLDFLDEHEDAFERSLEVSHFTASAWLLSRDLSKVLLMNHAKLNMWIQLGGHADGDTDLLEVAIKEAQEESGITDIEPVMCDIFDIGIHTVPAYVNEPAHEHFDVRFILRVASDEQPIQNRESKELRWVGKDRSQLPTNQPSVVRMFDKWIDLF
jgi:8-oxo-dGTP pyrophosphatase MutT (NUDIX family)